MPGKNNFAGAVATMVGIIIGAGVLGIPYVVAKAGLLTGITAIILIGLVVLVMYLYFGEVVLRTKGRHQMPGYAEIYLGKWGKGLMTFSMIFGIYGALVAYILGEGATLNAIFGGNVLAFQIGFLIVVGTIIYTGIKSLEKSEIILSFCVITLLIIIAAIAIPHIRSVNLTGFNAMKFFVPYGVVLFAFLGMQAIPEIREELEGEEKRMKKAIIIGFFIPLVMYILFAFAVVGVVGYNNFEALPENHRVATIALGNQIGQYTVVFGNLFAVFAMATSFIALGFAIMKMFEYDFGINKNIAFLFTMGVPFLIALSGMTNFIQVIGISGMVAGGITGILIVLMFWKAKKHGQRRPEYTIRKNKILGYMLMTVFIFGALLALAGM